MEKYIGFKVIQAEPTSWKEFSSKNLDVPDCANVDDEAGYAIVDGDTVYFKEKESFEKEYFIKLNDQNTISKEIVDSSVKNWQHTTLNDLDGKPKTVIVMATLMNGFVIVESSSCVDPANFDFNIGFNCCVERIYNKVWELTGFILQSAQPCICVEPPAN